MLWLLVFLVTVALDIIWVWTITALEKDNVTQSVMASMIGAGFVGFSTIVYVADPWLLIPEIAGNGVGTWLAIKLRRVLDTVAFLRGS